jgi:hypothetical protein
MASSSSAFPVPREDKENGKKNSVYLLVILEVGEAGVLLYILVDIN